MKWENFWKLLRGRGSKRLSECTCGVSPSFVYWSHERTKIDTPKTIDHNARNGESVRFLRNHPQPLTAEIRAGDSLPLL